ncbi:KilA-N domain-containing protein [Hymenobacter nivis]|uniref:DNA-binding protein n=1 Tax=Hymenobacter nivis TaxID=1850093 RepID=A0A2Z3GR34_9BACT|nr:KilA-N domain-containing protein [Hymenobacter nivis]AWM33515.1 DNA-binding protein [Hymenobacter nivis]
MKNKLTMTVQSHPILVTDVLGQKYINISQLAAAGTKAGEDAGQAVSTWLRAGDTMKYLAAWEKLYGSKGDFGDDAFQEHMADITRKSFSMSPDRWVKTTNAIGIEVKRGRGGAVFAHEDIALEFCTWLDPVFKLYVLKEFQRLKEEEQKVQTPDWTIKRLLSKVNYRIQTDAVRDHLLPTLKIAQNKERFEYAEEADVLNLAVFGITAREWRETNPARALQGYNLRDNAGTHELAVIANLEVINAMLMKDQHPRAKRLGYLSEMAADQLRSLSKLDIAKSMEATQKIRRLPPKPANEFDASLKGLMAIPPPPKPEKRKKPEPPKDNEADGESDAELVPA